jgi:hypothetical protein
MNKDNIIKDLIDTGSDITGNFGGAVIGALIAGPPGAIVGSISGPIVKKLFSSIGTEISERLLSKREHVRIGAAYAYAIKKIEENNRKGLIIRNDYFFENTDFNRSKAEEILEGILLCAQKSYEEKKIKYIGNLYANIIYKTEIDKELANYFIKLSNELTYRQFCLIVLFKDNLEIKSYDDKLDSNHPDFIKRKDLISEIRDLFNKGFLSIVTRLSDTEDYSAPILTGDIAINGLGKQFIEYLDLIEISVAELEEIKKQYK